MIHFPIRIWTPDGTLNTDPDAKGLLNTNLGGSRSEPESARLLYIVGGSLVCDGFKVRSHIHILLKFPFSKISPPCNIVIFMKYSYLFTQQC